MISQNLSGKKIPRRYFEGWYFKQQNGAETVALIPAFHVNKEGHPSASLQVITNDAAHQIDFSADEFLANRKDMTIRLGDSFFSRHGCRLHVKNKSHSLQGVLHFSDFTKPSYDMMGPFRFVPFMECRHSVFSLWHRVDGMLSLNGRDIRFHAGTGYAEGDRGVSFPQRYVWTQCSWSTNSVMLSVADIPFGNGSFIGCIGSIYLHGTEHRLATYLGVKLLHISSDTVLVRQGEWMLKVRLLKSVPLVLRAPDHGSMVRSIYESASCQVRYTCTLGKTTVFDFVSDTGSFESNWEEKRFGL